MSTTNVANDLANDLANDEAVALYDELVSACIKLIEQADFRYEHQYEGLEEAQHEQQFNDLALRIFAYQFKFNRAYQAYCRQKGKTPRTIVSWRDIPAVPLQAFKQSILSCTDPEHAQALFMTSGTTNQQVRGKHYHPGLRLYDASMKTAFKWNVSRRGINDDNNGDKRKLVVLFPMKKELPNSSLAHYLHLAVEHYGGNNSNYVVDEQGLNANKLMGLLQQAQNDHEPLLLLGATFSYVHAFDLLRQQGLRFNLPAGSVLMDTGGTKGRSRDIEQEWLYEEAYELLDIGRNSCINMYGMTELSTQFYDNGLIQKPGKKYGPPWIRTRAVNPLTGQELPLGEAGLLIHCDLANVNSVTTILTEDVGYITENRGFVLLGRAEGSAAKGCSLAMEDFLNSSRKV